MQECLGKNRFQVYFILRCGMTGPYKLKNNLQLGKPFRPRWFLLPSICPVVPKIGLPTGRSVAQQNKNNEYVGFGNKTGVFILGYGQSNCLTNRHVRTKTLSFRNKILQTHVKANLDRQLDLKRDHQHHLNLRVALAARGK